MATYVKDRFGNIAPAFNLIMRKEFAYPILQGTKKIEFRQVSDEMPDKPKKNKDRYAAIFFKRYLIEDKGHPDFLVPKDIYCVHAHDYGNTWYLDFSIEGVDIVAIHPDNAEYFHKYGHHEFDEVMAKMKTDGVKPHDKEVQWWYCLPITAIIDTNLDLSNCPNVMAYSIPEGCEITDPKLKAEAERLIVLQNKPKPRQK